MKAWSKLQRLFKNRQAEADMADEMRLHLELQAERNLAAGMSVDEARFAARREFGGVEQIKEQCREQRSWVWVEQVGQDLRYAFRSLRKHRGFTFVAVLTIALGIGVNATVLSFINDLIVRPLVRDRAEHLVAIHNAQSGAARSFRRFNYNEYTLIQDRGTTFSGVAAMQFSTSAVGRDEDVRRRLLCLVSENYFSVLGVKPLRGRFFNAEETRPNANIPVAVATYSSWQRAGGREDFVGSEVRINGRAFTIIGIAPAGFGGLHWSLGPHTWLPLGVSSTLIGAWGDSVVNDLMDSRSFRLELFGTLRPGLSMTDATRELSALNATLNAQAGSGAQDARELLLAPPSRFNISIATPPSHESVVSSYATAALGVTVIVLLVACLNVANMLFSRGVSRQKEIAIRLSLGASRWRVVRQLLVEGLLLSLGGGVVGLVLSRWSNDLTFHLAKRHGGPMVLHLKTTLDWPLLAATSILCLLATLVFSLLPALRATKINVVEDLKRQPGEPAGAGRWARFFSFRHCVVMAQIALSLMLLFSTGLLIRAVMNLEQGRGFATDHQVVANLDYWLAGVPEKEMLARQRDLLNRMARLPGIERVALASTVPFSSDPNWRRVFVVGSDDAIPMTDRETDEQGRNGAYTAVSHGYFTTLGIPLLRGRDFTEAEATVGGGLKVAILDESLARVLFGESDPIGRHIAMSRSDARRAGRELEIVGIVRSPREDAFQPAGPLRRIYRPIGQAGTANTYVHVKVAAASSLPAMVTSVRQELRSIEPHLPLLLCEPLADFVGSDVNLWTVRFLTGMFTAFGFIAVVLAVVGIYSVKSYIVARRTQEIGIRMALGARSSDVLRMILRQGVLQTVIGVAVGLSLGVFAGQFLSKLLYRINPFDPVTMIGAAALLATVSILACLAPAIRATRINAAVALRAE